MTASRLKESRNGHGGRRSLTLAQAPVTGKKNDL